VNLVEIQNKLQKQWDIKEQSIKYGSEQVEKGVIGGIHLT